MKRNYIVLSLAVLLLLTAAPSAGADTRLNINVGYPNHSDLDVFVWPDRGIDAIYYPGDPIRIFFEVTRDCYVVIYDIDTRGRLHILFPFDPWQDNFVEAGRVYELPGDWDNFRLTVDGPTGTEYVQAIASPHPFDLPDWPIYINSPGFYPTTCADPELMDFRAGHDRISYIQRVNRKISRHRWDWCATDLARFYVHRHRPPIHPPWPRRIHIDPWPDIFYGEIYIGWPIGTHIYVDGIFMGIAPCWIPGISYGHHWIRCYDGHRVVHEQRVGYRHKYAYRKDHSDYRIRGSSKITPYRTAPGTSVTRVERSRNNRSAHKKDPNSSVRRKPGTRPANGKVVDRRPVERTRPANDGYRPTRRDQKPDRKITMPRSPKVEKRSKGGGLKAVLSTAGRLVADAAGKVAKREKRSTTSGSRSKKSGVKEAKKSSSKGKDKLQRRSGSKKW